VLDTLTIDGVVELTIAVAAVPVPIGAVELRGPPVRGLSESGRLESIVVVEFELGPGMTLAGAVVVRLAEGLATPAPPVERLMAVAADKEKFKPPKETGAVPSGVMEAFALGNGVKLEAAVAVTLKGGMAPNPEAMEDTEFSSPTENELTWKPESSSLKEVVGLPVMLGI
jgi:hypothetical protein